MLTQQPRQTQQAKCIFKGQILRLLALGQGGPLGFRVLITDLATLDVWPVLTKQHVDEVSSFWILSKRLGPVSFLLENELRLLLI